MGIAAALKLTPLVLLPYVALRDRRAGVRMLLVFFGICLLALPVGGIAAWRALLRESGPNAAAWQTYWHNGLSFRGLWSRLLVGGEFARPLVAAPLVARGLELASVATLFGIALYAVRAAPDNPSRAREGALAALWYVLMVVVNPLAWPHYAILLLLPATLAGRAARATGDKFAALLLTAALALLSIPKETLLALAGGLPASPVRGLALALPLGGALALYAASARGAFGIKGAQT
jgi:Glycosyltransferase family 87